ncbi:MAG TPA: hypothetical protein VGG99_05120 [Acetobacteraceae bacterium]|jgi:hypothetical protein
MGDLNTAPAEAYDPDPDRADPDSPDLMPQWLASLIALVILFLLEQFQALQQRHPHRPASRPARCPALPRASADAPASIRRQSDDATTRTRRGRDAAPGFPDLSHARTALLEKLRQSDIDPDVLSQLETLGIVPSLNNTDIAATPIAATPTLLCVAKILGAPRMLARAGTQHRVLPAPWRRTFAHPGTGPPTGPRAVSRCQSCYA